MINEVKEETKLQMKKCKFCGGIVPVNALKCKHCGEWLVKKEGKSWVKTYLLCCYLGIFGAHDFYNNKTGIGIAKILTFFGFFGIWTLIDSIMILCNAYTDNQGRKLSRKPTIQSTAGLCLLGGIGGLHRFYTGHIAIGLLQVFTLGGFFIWTIVDLILILSGKFKDSNGRLIRE